jgi:hypothetical protein
LLQAGHLSERTHSSPDPAATRRPRTLAAVVVETAVAVVSADMLDDAGLTDDFAGMGEVVRGRATIIFRLPEIVVAFFDNGLGSKIQAEDEEAMSAVRSG